MSNRSTRNNKKKTNYLNEARVILNELKKGNEYLAKRLEKKIEEYQTYIGNWSLCMYYEHIIRGSENTQKHLK